MVADVVDTLVLVNDADRYVVRFTNEGGGDGESNVIKVNKSDLADIRGLEPLALDIEWIQYHVGGSNYVTLRWDHTTDDEIAVLPPGADKIDFLRDFGGPLRDPRSAGGTSDILLTTDGNVDGNSYSIIISIRLRRQP